MLDKRTRKPAPELIPIIPGLARLLFKEVCRINPETKSDAPQKTTAINLGSLIFKSIIFEEIGISLPLIKSKIAFRPSKKTSPFVPASREKKEKGTPIVTLRGTCFV